MKTPYQVLKPYLWDDPEGGQNVCDGDAIAAMKEYAKMYHEFQLKAKALKNKNQCLVK